VSKDIDSEELRNDGRIGDESRALVATRSQHIKDTLLSSRRLTMGYHNGRLQVLPPTWTFPKMNIKQLVDNWYIGNKKESVPPMKLLQPLHVQHLGTRGNKNAGRVKLRQMKCVMNQVESYAKTEGIYEDNPSKWNSEHTTKIWGVIGDKYINSRFQGNRTAEMSWKTLYNKMLKANTFQVNNNT
jgi:hypothetical protein